MLFIKKHFHKKSNVKSGMTFTPFICPRDEIIQFQVKLLSEQKCNSQFPNGDTKLTKLSYCLCKTLNCIYCSAQPKGKR